jgi:hypothetical protein
LTQIPWHRTCSPWLSPFDDREQKIVRPRIMNYGMYVLGDLIMHPNSSRVSHYAAGNRQAEFVAVLERVLPRSLPGLETVALYLLLCVFWGLILFAVLTNAL